MPKEKRSARNIRWVEKWCVVPDGQKVGQKLELRDWEKDAIRQIYDNPHGTRTAIVSLARKNGKSTFVACILLLHLVGPEHKINSQIPSTATSRDQAAVLFNLASNMVRMNPELRELVDIRDSVKEMYVPALGTHYAALSAEAKTAYGKSPVLALHDELGQVRGDRSDLFNAIETGMGAHEEPLSIVLSTQAPSDGDLLSVLIDEAKAGNDPHTVLILYEADMDADPFAIDTIKQANPAFGDYLNQKEIMRAADKAKRLPSQEAYYRNYHLNQRVEVSSPFIPMSVWEANGDDPGALSTVYAGLDLSETNDLTALVLVSPGRKSPVYPTFWLPEEGLVERARQDRVPYDVWAEKGYLKTTPGRSVEYQYVAKYLVSLIKEHNIRKIAFDRWNMRHLKPWLVKAGLSETVIDELFQGFGQGYQSMSPALRNLESLLLNERLQHGKHPVLRMCAANSVTKMDEAGGRKLDKKKSTGRIDGMVALAMACAVMSEDQHQKPVYPVALDSIVEDLRT